MTSFFNIASHPTALNAVIDHLIIQLHQAIVQLRKIIWVHSEKKTDIIAWCL